MSAYVTVDIETTGTNPLKDELLCVGIGDRVYPADEGRAMARRLMVRPGTVLVAHTNFDLRWLMLGGAKLGPNVFYHDTKTMAWLLDGTQPLDLESLTTKYCGYTPNKRLRQVAKRVMFRTDCSWCDSEGCSVCSDPKSLVPIEDAPWDELSAYNRSDLRAEGDLYEALRAELRKAGMWAHFLKEEAPFSRLLLEMEAAGMPFDAEAAKVKLALTEADMASRAEWLVNVTGAPGFNLASGDQVARFLYTEAWEQDVRFDIPRLVGMSKEDKLAAVEGIAPPGVRVNKVGRDYAYGTVLLDGVGLKPPKRDKKQKTARPSVSGKKLAVLYGGNPWVDEFVAWKKLEKLAGYLRDWIEREHGGNLYGRFDQSGTATGRLAAREPNLQQVAKESDIRDLFRGDLVIGDYGGLEVRISAHFSHDPVMMEIFGGGGDLYGTLAAEAWGGAPDKTNPNRPLMKVVMLGCPAPEERLLTRDLRWIAAGDLKPGDQLWTLDENLNDGVAGRARARRYRPGEVVQSFLAKKERVRVWLETGESFVCTDDHPWLAAHKNGKFKQRWVKARDLTSDWSVRRCMPTWEAEDTRSAGWLAGFLDGEGCISGGKNRRGGVSAVQVVGPTADRMVAELRRYGTVSVDHQVLNPPHQERLCARLLHKLGPADTAQFLGRVRPERLIGNFDLTGGVVFGELVPVAAIEKLGLGDIQCIETSTHTYIGEGFPMHNSQYGAAGETLAFVMSLAGIPTTPAKADGFLRDLKNTLPRMFEWRQEVIAQAEVDGYVETLAGRRRRLVGIKSADWQKKGTAERQAVSTKVQGSAADIVRRAMLAARAAVAPEAARICLQVHDELVWRRGPEWSDDVFPRLVDICQYGHGFELDVPLIFEAKLAQSWGEKGDAIPTGAYEHLEAVT